MTVLLASRSDVEDRAMSEGYMRIDAADGAGSMVDRRQVVEIAKKEGEKT